MEQRPTLLLTLGDVAGIGPEVAIRAWPSSRLHEICRPIVVGDLDTLRRTAAALQASLAIHPIQAVAAAESSPDRLGCIQGTSQLLSQTSLGRVSAAAGRAAYDFLCLAIDLTLAKEADGIVTLPLHKEGLHLAGVPHPGHTEILAERTNTPRFAMMLYFEKLGVTHVTLHLAMRQALDLITRQNVADKIVLTAVVMRQLLGREPRIGVAGLNPHASDGGLFGNEESQIIGPAVADARSLGIDASGPWPADTLFVRARAGEFDGLVVQYHDQGHVPMKLLAGFRAVNVSLGMPIVRTSVAHGTAYDIAGRGIADPEGLIEAAIVAARLTRAAKPNPDVGR